MLPANDSVAVQRILRFSSFRRRYSRPLLIVYSREKPVDDNDENEDERGKGATWTDAQTDREESLGEKSQNRQHKSMFKSERVKMPDDRKKASNRETASRVSRAMERRSYQLARQKVAPSTGQITRKQQNYSVAAGWNMRHDLQGIGRLNQMASFVTTTVRPHTHTAVTRHRMTKVDSRKAIKEQRRRPKRDIFNNEVEIPEDDVEHRGRARVPDAGYRPTAFTQSNDGFGLPGRTERHRSTSVVTQHTDKQTGYDDDMTDGRSVFDIGNVRGGEERGKRRNPARRRRKQLMTLLRNSDEYFTGGQIPMSDKSSCRKKRLRVNFADIGWDKWIIAPEFIDAFYCDGSCNFPMARKLRPTNHATIQSIVQAVGKQVKLPAPCCVPASLTSVTLLYVDQHDNVVLKNFPEMSVSSCACR